MLLLFQIGVVSKHIRKPNKIVHGNILNAGTPNALARGAELFTKVNK